MRNGWSHYTERGSVHRRAGGRRRWNAVQKAKALELRIEILRYVQTNYPEILHPFWGLAAEIERSLGISRATASRHLRALFYRSAGLAYPAMVRPEKQ